MIHDSHMRYLPQGDWRDQREVHRILARDKGEILSDNIPREEWEYVQKVIAAFREMRQAADHPVCAECGHIIQHGLVIRCLDCSAPFHESYCAAKHFWPKGRPQSTWPTAFGQPMRPDPDKGG